MAEIKGFERGGANKIFQGLSKSYKKKQADFSDESFLNKFFTDTPAPKRSDFPIGVNGIKEFEAAEKAYITGSGKNYQDSLKNIYKNPEYKTWLDNHVKNGKATSMLNSVNKGRRLAYTAFWTLIGGAAGIGTVITLRKHRELKHRQKLAKLPKTPVKFKKAEGQPIEIFKYVAATNTIMGRGLVYKIQSTDKLYKVETKRNSARLTLIQFPGDKYYWVPTTELVNGGGWKETPDEEPVKVKPKTPTPKAEPIVPEEPTTTPDLLPGETEFIPPE
jgi:hypothetical protein